MAPTSNNKITLDNLPDLILENIFEKCAPNDPESLSLTSKKMKKFYDEFENVITVPNGTPLHLTIRFDAEGRLRMEISRLTRRYVFENPSRQKFLRVLKNCSRLVLPDLKIMEAFPEGSPMRNSVFNAIRASRIVALDLELKMGDSVEEFTKLINVFPKAVRKYLLIGKDYLKHHPLPDLSIFRGVTIRGIVTVDTMREVLKHKNLVNIKCHTTEAVEILPYMLQFEKGERHINNWDLWFQGTQILEGGERVYRNSGLPGQAHFCVFYNFGWTQARICN